MSRSRGILVSLALALGACAGSATAPKPSTAPTESSTTATTTRPTTPATTVPSTTTSPATTSTASPTTTLDAATITMAARAVLMIGIPFATLDEASRDHFSGGGRSVILFTGNIDDAASVTALTREVACAAGGPVLVAVDQELSPQVRRLGPELITPLPTTDEALTMPLAELEEAGRRLGNELLNLGINMNLAPVIDVVRGENPVLETRHLGSDPAEVSERSVAFIRGLGDTGVIAVPKHFPGHGLSRTDPHEVTPVIDASLDELAAVDFIPFRAVFDAGVRAVMVGHPVYTEIDPDRPASLSPIVLSVLRDAFGFDGVAVTDSLSIAAVTTDHSAGELTVAALVAGEDLLLFQDHTRLEEGVEGIIEAVESGGLDEDRLLEAAEKVRALADSVPDQCA